MVNPLNQEEFEKVVNKFTGKESFRGDLWYRCRRLVEMNLIYEGYTLLLATWNFARFRYKMKKLTPKQFVEMIEKTENLFIKFEKYNFMTIDLENEENLFIIKKIYDIFREIEGIEQTGAAKLMCLRRPDLFIMWDTQIRKKYDINDKGTSEDYIYFFKKMKEKFGHLKWIPDKKPFAKAIDEYNYHIVHSEDKSH